MLSSGLTGGKPSSSSSKRSSSTAPAATQKPCSATVNFSELSEGEQQKYVEFLLSNNFIFDADSTSDDNTAYHATIKISPSSISSNTPRSPNSLTSPHLIRPDRLKKQPISSAAVSGLEVKSSARQSSSSNQRQNRSPLQCRSLNTTTQAVKKHGLPHLNIKQGEFSKPQRKPSISIEELSLMSSSTTTTPQQQQQQVSEVELKKQLMLEKLQMKLLEASKLEEDTHQQQQQLQQQQGKSKLLKLEIPDENSRPGLRSISPQDKQPRSRGISKILMDKNKQYVCRLQEAMKQKGADKHCSAKLGYRKNSVSPSSSGAGAATTPRKQTTQEVTLSNNRLVPIWKQQQPQNIWSNNNCYPDNQSARTPRHPQQFQQPSQQHPPQMLSTFEQIMKKQSSLINSVCSQLPARKHSPAASGAHITITNSDIDYRKGFSVLPPTGGAVNMTSSNAPKNSCQSDNFYSFKSFGNSHIEQQQQQQSKLPPTHRSQHSHHQQSLSESSNYPHAAASFHENSHRLQEAQLEESRRVVEDDLVLCEFLEGFNGLSELRRWSCGEQSLMLRPSRVPLAHLLKLIDELYQAKFNENTERMKCSANKKSTSSNSSCTSSTSEDIPFSEFISDHFKKTFASSKKVTEQHLLNLIATVESFLLRETKKLIDEQLIAIATFAAFVQGKYSQEELIFYLFVREMLVKSTTTPSSQGMNNILATHSKEETSSIELTLDHCQRVLENVFGHRESRIIERLMFRLSERLSRKDGRQSTRILAPMFLLIALNDYIEGKQNRIYESEESNTVDYKRGEDQEDDIPGLTSYERLEHTFEQSFGEGDMKLSRPNNINCQNTNKSSCRSNNQRQIGNYQNFSRGGINGGQQSSLSQSSLSTNSYNNFVFGEGSATEQRVWEKMVQKIRDFIELVIADSSKEEVNDDSCEGEGGEEEEEEESASVAAGMAATQNFDALTKILQNKINKMMSALTRKDMKRWLELICVSKPTQTQFEHFKQLGELLEDIADADPIALSNAHISNFCKALLQTKELTKAIGKLLVCVLMPDATS